MSSDLECNEPKCHRLQPSDYIGLTIVTQSGFISFAAVLYVYGLIGYTAFKIARRNGLKAVRSLFFRKLEANDIFMLSLFTADAIQGLGAIVNIQWLRLQRAEKGNFCTAQGVIQQLGETTVAVATCTIALYTFLSLWTGKILLRRRGASIVSIFIWLAIGTAVTIGAALPRPLDKEYFSPTPYWCWISKDYMKWRIWGEYFWFWLTLGFSIISYTLLFFWARGNIHIDEDRWWIVRFQRSQQNPVLKSQGIRRQSFIMLSYPLIYCLSIVPITVVRFILFNKERRNRQLGLPPPSVPAAAQFFTVSIHDLSGFFNVVLLILTRPESALFGYVPRRPELVLPSAAVTASQTYTLGDRSAASQQVSDILEPQSSTTATTLPSPGGGLPPTVLRRGEYLD